MLTVAPAETKLDGCPAADDCVLFRLYGLRGSLAVLRSSFCDGRFERCARYQARCLGQAVPANLLPNGRAFGGYVPVR